MHTKAGQQRQHRREERIAKAFNEQGISFDREFTVQFCGEANQKCARVDFVLYRQFGTILLEVDEFEHAHYGVTCETARMLDILGEQIKQQNRSGKIHIIRLNIDSYSEQGVEQHTSIKDRIVTLLQTIEKEPVLQYSVTYLYYSRTDSPLPDTCLDPEYPGTLRAIVNF